MRNFLRRRFDYTARMHMKRRARSFDYRFFSAIVALGLLVWAALRLL